MNNTETEVVAVVEPKTEEKQISVSAERTAKMADAVMDGKRKNLTVIPYVSASDCLLLGTGIPLKLAYPTIYALNTLEEKLGMNPTDFVKLKLGYDSRLFVCKAFAAEQVDAIALAIYQIERGKAFILGDFAGVGKGRCAAGLLRYAYHKGMHPVFMTRDASLFTDIYGDLYDIGGFNNDTVSVKHLPKPFVLNTVNIMNPLEREEDILYPAYKRDETIALCKKKEVPKNHKITLLTYNQISGEVEAKGTRNENKKAIMDYLLAIAPHSFFMMDESHCASAEKSWIGSNMRAVLSLAKACSFASATYAKTPATLRFYASKTDIQDAPVDIDEIVKYAEKNGEVIQEYVANKLVRGGQYIRRERAYDGCDINSDFVGKKDKEDKEKYYGIYDSMIAAFNKIHDLNTSDYIKNAIDKVVSLTAKEYKLTVVVQPDFGKDKRAREEWIAENENNYYATYYNTQTTASGKSQWIESLLFSIKADYVADKAIYEMQHKFPVDYVEAEVLRKKEVNRKPVIFLRSTGDSLIDRLGYKNGMVIPKEEADFSQTLVDLVSRLIFGKLTFERVGNRKDKITKEDVSIREFLIDKGEIIDTYIKEFRSMLAGIPLSPIDHIINKISGNTKEKVKRPDWDTEYSTSPTYVVEDSTKRGLRLIEQEDGTFLVAYKQDEASTIKFARFNSGVSDVAIINAAASTGVSIHSKSTFKDKRQRIAIIHQVELDVATEVQKRGRINRSGQVCKPAYLYVVSVIPAETRRLISLARKLRSLDANTSGNMKQSSQMSSFVGSDGKPIEDVYNKYGFDALETFCNLSENSKPLWKGGESFRSMLDKYKLVMKRYGSDKEDTFKGFTAHIDVLPSAIQELFYTGVNSEYLAIKTTHEENDTWDLDLDIIDLRSSVRTKKLLMKGHEENVFAEDVFFEDRYTSVIVKTLSKNEIKDMAKKLALKLNDTAATPEEAHKSFVKEYQEYIERAVVRHVNLIPIPDKKDKVKYPTKEDFEQAMIVYEQTKKDFEADMRKEKAAVLSKIATFKPLMPSLTYLDIVTVKAWVDSHVDDDTAEFDKLFSENFKSVPSVFVGIKLYTKEADNLIDSNIAFVFAPLNTKSELIEITPSKNGIRILAKILSENHNKLPYGNLLTEINLWQIKGRVRENSRMLTGDLLTGLSVVDGVAANEMMYSPRRQILNFTNADGSVDVGIRLFPAAGIKNFPHFVSDRNLSLTDIEFIRLIDEHGDKDTVIGNNIIRKDNRYYDLYISAEEGDAKSPFNDKNLLTKIENLSGNTFEEQSYAIKLANDKEETEHTFHYISIFSKEMADVLYEMKQVHAANVSIEEEAAGVFQIAGINSPEYIDYVMSDANRYLETDKGRKIHGQLFISESDFTEFHGDDDVMLFFPLEQPKARKSIYSDHIKSLSEKIGGYNIIHKKWVKFPSLSGRITVKDCIVFNLNKQSLLTALQHLFAIKPTYIPLVTSDYVVYKQEDIPAGSGAADVAGEYKYILLSPFSVDKTPPDFIRQERRDGYPYGMVVLRYPTQSIMDNYAFGMIPYNIPIKEAIRLLNSVLFTDANKNFLYEFAQANKDNPSSVAVEAQRLIKIHPKYIFGGGGADLMKKIGQYIIANFVPSKESENVERADEEGAEIKVEPINLKGLRDAENYLMRITQLI